MSSRTWTVLVVLSLMGRTALAQQEPDGTVQATRRIELAATGQTVPEVVVSAGLSTVLLFDSELARESVELEGREHFSLLEVGQTVIRLIPSPHPGPGARMLMMVRFRDGAAPQRASFLLRVHPARAESVVEVYREKRTLETYQQEVREARAVALRCQEENARLLSERDLPAGLTGLLATGVLESEGVAVGELRGFTRPGSGSGFAVRPMYFYRSASRIAVEATIGVAEGRQPWMASGATIKDTSGGELKVLRVWQQEAIAPGRQGRVIVEAEYPSGTSQRTFSLRLWEDGSRVITLGGVTFP
ncbi:DUF2381 family protein [Corallococcus llansteffanensis]|uniref:DUF2381 family protein n=1 Tax=Corallococcus llansteffanensis TaxID=2316731 RepID=UPI001FC93650|nr:DUF2381 family protein [Corallococcus llansteffanensis]